MAASLHWFVQPEVLCVQCGKPSSDAAHKRRCNAVWSFGAGYAFCQLEAGHDGPDICRNWDGSLWRADFDGVKGEQVEPAPADWYG